MIKFFRHIRQNQIMENKTGKYFKYAIGEILLVMIGILLALQVSNWNSTRIKNKLEKTTLSQLNSDINTMLGDVKGDYEALKMGTKSHLNVLKYLEHDFVYNDTMCFDFQWLIKLLVVCSKNTFIKRLLAKKNGLHLQPLIVLRVCTGARDRALSP